MKTVQEWLRELDTEKLIEEYLYIDPIQYDRNESYLNRTVGEIKNAYKERLREYIERLRKVSVAEPEDGHQGLLYVHRIIKDGVDDQTFEMIHVDEFLEKGYDAPDYAYEFTDQAEIVGFLVADTPLTQRYIYELIADVMNEASFFGYEQEDLAEERQKLEEAAKEIDAGTAKTIPWETVKEEMERERGYTFDEESEDEKELHYKVIDAEMAYSKHSREKELDAIRALLLAGRDKQ